MKWLIVGIALLVSACASTKPTESYIRVIGTGETSKIAREDAFQKAIEINVGTLVLSDYTARNNQLIRKELGSHSAGYITDFKVITENITNGKVTVVMDVLVHTSRIHERLLSVSKSDKEIKGESLYEQYRSYNQSKDTAYRLLNQVLNDYPSKAFNVSNPTISCGQGRSGSHCFKLDRFGNAVIEVPYEVRWNYNFLRALNEAMGYISDPGYGGEKFTIISKHPDKFIGSTDRYNFNEVSRLKNIKMRFLGTVYLHANVVDIHGKSLYNNCTSVYSVPHIDYAGFIIRGNDYVSDKLHITIDRTDKISKADRVELSISRRGC